MGCTCISAQSVIFLFFFCDTVIFLFGIPHFAVLHYLDRTSYLLITRKCLPRVWCVPCFLDLLSQVYTSYRLSLATTTTMPISPSVRSSRRQVTRSGLELWRDPKFRAPKPCGSSSRVASRNTHRKLATRGSPGRDRSQERHPRLAQENAPDRFRQSRARAPCTQPRQRGVHIHQQLSSSRPQLAFGVWIFWARASLPPRRSFSEREARRGAEQRGGHIIVLMVSMACRIMRVACPRRGCRFFPSGYCQLDYSDDRW